MSASCSPEIQAAPVEMNQKWACSHWACCLVRYVDSINTHEQRSRQAGQSNCFSFRSPNTWAVGRILGVCVGLLPELIFPGDTFQTSPEACLLVDDRSKLVDNQDVQPKEFNSKSRQKQQQSQNKSPQRSKESHQCSGGWSHLKKLQTLKWNADYKKMSGWRLSA